MSFVARRNRIARGAGLRRDKRPQLVGMLQPGLLDGVGDPVLFQNFLQYLPAAREMAAHDGVLGMRYVERSSLVCNRAAEKCRRMLVLQFLDPPCVGLAEEKTNHPVGVNTVDERIDDGSQFRFAAQLLEEARLRSGLHFTIDRFPAVRGNIYAIPSCSLAASDIRLGSQGGSQTRSIFTPVTPRRARILRSTSAGSD